MKSFQRSLIVLLIVIFLLAWWFWMSKRVSPPPAEPPVKTVFASPAITVVPNGTTSQSSAAKINPASVPPPASNPVDPKVAKIEAIWATQNAQAQDFYGKVIDQDGRPVAGAAALGTLLWIQGVDVGEKREQHTVQTDRNGEFQFTGFHAWRLAVAVTKKGYEMGRTAGVYEAPNEQDKTSAAARAIFHMWKLKGAEPMVKARIHAYIPCDGTPTMFDLLTGKKVASGGDLTIRLTRDPVQIVRGKPFGWQLSLEISGGGLQEITDLYPNEAPASGYQQAVTVSMPVGAKNWSTDCYNTYYFTAANGQEYGRINIDLTGDFQPPPTSFDADIYINPSSSRNLEFDPTQAIKP